MTFEELSAAPPDFAQWYVTVGYLDSGWCRQRADDWCEQPVMPQIAALPVSEPSAALMLACGLIALGLMRSMRR